MVSSMSTTQEVSDMRFFKLYMKGYIEFMLGALGALYIVISMMPDLIKHYVKTRGNSVL